jgi:hypothetical protein
MSDADAVSPTAVCATTGTTLSVAVSGETTVSDPLLISALLNGSAFDYDLSLPNTTCSGLPVAEYPSVDVTSTGTQSQYVVIDNSSGQFASSGSSPDVGCLVGFNVDLTAPASGTDVLAVADDDTSPGTGDDTVGVTSSLVGTSPTETLTLSQGACGTLTDVTVPPGYAVPNMLVEGVPSSGNELTFQSDSSAPLTVNVGYDNGSGPGEVGGLPGGVAVQFNGEQSIVGAAAGTDFQPGGASGVTFIGQGSGAADTLDLSTESSSSFTSFNVAMNFSGCAGDGGLTSTGTTAITDCFSNIGTVQGAPSVPTSFQPDPTLTTTPSDIPTFVGNDSNPGGSDVDLTGFSSSPSDTVTELSAAIGGDTQANPGLVSATVNSGSVTFATFYGVDEVKGSSSLGTDFQPGTAPGVTFTGQGSGTTNTLDLSTETSSSFPSSATFVVAMASSGCAGDGEVTSTGSTTIADCFSGVDTVLGATSVPTSFEPDFELTTTPSSPPIFVGNCSSPGGSTVDLTGFASSPSDSVSGLTVEMNADTQAGAGQVSATVNSEGVTFATFYGVNEVKGSTSLGTDFQTGSASGVNFTGQGTGTTNTLDLSAAPAQVLIDAASSPGEVSGLGGGGSDTFTGVTSFIGSSGGETTFVAPGSPGDDAFTGEGPGNTLSVSALPIGATIDVGTATVTVGGTTYLTFADIQNFVGSNEGFTTFRPDSSGGFSFVGDGSGNALNLSAAPASVVIQADGTAGEATGLSGGGSDAFQDIQTFVGSSAGGTTFEVGGIPGGDAFTGQGTANTLSLSALAVPLAIDVGTGTVTLGGTSSGSVSFSDVQTFIGSAEGSTTFVAGSTGGYVFTGGGSAGTNTLSFQGVTGSAGVTVDLADDSASPRTGTDSFTGIATIVGSPNNDTFLAGPGNSTINGGGGNDTLSFAAAANPVTVSLAAGTGTVTGGYGGTTTTTGVTTFIGSNGGGNTFDADGYGGYSFIAPSGSSGNSLSFAGVESSAGVTDLAVSITSSSGNGTASGLSTTVTGGGTDTFQGFQSFIGSPSSDSFSVGAGALTLSGGGGGSDSLSFADAPAGDTFNLAAAPQTVTGSQVDDTISGFETITGSSVGSNDFEASGSGYILIGQGNGNILDLSALSTGTTVDVGTGTVAVGGTSYLSFSGIQTYVGSAGGSTTFDADGTGGCAFDAVGSGNTLNLSQATPGITVAVGDDNSTSPGTVSGLPGGTNDSFSDITSIVGSSAGQTTFVAPGTFAGLSFAGSGGGNTLDTSAFPASSIIDNNPDSSQADEAILSGSASDSFSGISCFVGSAAGSTTFEAGPAADPAAACDEPGVPHVSFAGQGSGNNTLDISAFLPDTSINVGTGAVESAGTTDDTFSSVQQFVGSTAGSTTFVAVDTGGYTFDAGGAANTLDLSAAPTGTTVTVGGDSFSSPGTVFGLLAGVGGATSRPTGRISGPTTDSFADIQHFTGPVTVISSVVSLPATLPSAVVGTPYSQQLTGSGGSSPYAGWSVMNGSLPAGITLSATGVLSGTPTTGGTFSFVVSLLDGNDLPGATSYSLTVSPASPVTPPRPGYDLVGSDGGVFVFGTPGQGFYGSLPGIGVHVANIVGIVPTSNDEGYFLVGSDGGVFAFGNAPFEDSLPGLGVHVANIVGIVPTTNDKGYFLVGSDGGVFAFGNAPFEDSLPGLGVHVADIVGIVPTADDGGYWLVGSTGAVYALGNAPFLGGLVGASPAPIVGIAATRDSGGYWLVAQNGAVYPFGDAKSFGDLPDLKVSVADIVAIVPTPDGQGYWLIGSDGGIFAFGDATEIGSLPGLGVHVTDIVGAVPTA